MDPDFDFGYGVFTGGVMALVLSVYNGEGYSAALTIVTIGFVWMCYSVVMDL